MLAARLGAGTGGGGQISRTRAEAREWADADGVARAAERLRGRLRITVGFVLL